MALLALVPVGFTLLIWMAKLLLEKQGPGLSNLFPQISFFLFLHFLLPLTAVFIGTAIVADEVEERTLPYLLVRPVPRRTIILAKTVAGVVTVGMILFVSLGLTYSLMVLDKGVSNWVSNLPGLIRSGGVLFLGLLVYVPLFGFLGGTLKRPVLTGLLFSFGWENTVSLFPGNTKLFTVAYYLHVIFPHSQQSQSTNVRDIFFNFILPVQKTSPVSAVLVLLGMSVLFTFLTTSLLYIKEYRLEQS